MEKETIGKIMITEEEIRARAKEIGAQISKDYAGESVLMVGILKGAIMWMADVMKNVTVPVAIDFMVVSSYGASTKSSGIVRILKDLDTDIEGKQVIIIEDIVDSGITLAYIKKYLQGRMAKSVKVCSLLNKPMGRKADIEPDYAGFEVDDRFIIGYGLDYDQKYRNLPYISYLEGTEKERILEKE